MRDNPSQLTVTASNPKGKLPDLLAEKGISVQRIDDEMGFEDLYILSPRMVVERRTPARFLNGIKDKTLFTTAIFLHENYEIPIFILEGQINYDYTGFNPQAVRGALAALVTVYGISVFTVADERESAALITMFAQQEQIGVPEISLVPKRKAVLLPDLQRRVVEMLPGCGMVAARSLLQHFGSIRRIMQATEAELCQVPGIGAKKAAEIRQVLTADYESVDTEKQMEDAVQTQPGLLLDAPFKLLDRQHYIFTDQGERQIVDLVFFNPEKNDLILVELKRGNLNIEHENQLLNYLSNAHYSPQLRALLEAGASLNGILATLSKGSYQPKSPKIRVLQVDQNQIIPVLKQLRQQRLAPAVENPTSQL